jgi:hypothetical protein
MRDDASAKSAKNRGSEMMVRMVMREHNPSHRLLGYRADRAEKVLCLPRTRQRVDNYDAGVGDNKARVRSALGTSACVSHNGVNAGGERPEARMDGLWSRGPRKRHRDQNGAPTRMQRSH